MAEKSTSISENAANQTPRLPPKVFIVIPAYNESGSIGEVLVELKQLDADVVVVDDGSADGTSQITCDHTPHALRHLINRGQGAALQTGIEYSLRCGADYIVTFDADGQHSLSDLGHLLRPIETGECEVVLGSRFLGEAENISMVRRLTLKAATLFTRVVSQVEVTDTHNGLRAFSRKAAMQVQIKNDRMAHASELLDIIRGLNMPYREVPVHIRYTEYSMAKGQSLRGAFRILFDYFVGRVAS